MIRLRNISLCPGESEEVLPAKAAKALGVNPAAIDDLIIRRRSIDARKKHDVRIIYTVDVSVTVNEARIRSRAGKNAGLAGNESYAPPVPAREPKRRPVVVGFGPAGMFAALILAQRGLRPIVLERGADVDTRGEKVRDFWENGKLDLETNVQFGEGGAGAFSDGKLNTGISDRRIGFVLETLHNAGAHERILYDAKPHVGTDVLCGVVKNLRKQIISLGGEIRFRAKATGLSMENGRLTGLRLSDGSELDADCVILAIGHSARDTMDMLWDAGIPMQPKPFSMGVRIEHLQREISFAQYGEFAKNLPPADYKLNCHFPEGDSAYTFCMCPGGYVVAAASELGVVVTNGMSELRRDGENANSALLVTLTPDTFPDKSPLGGMLWQREIERRAFEAAGGDYKAPAQLLSDFLAGRKSRAAGRVEPSYRPGVVWCDLNTILPEEITSTLKKAIPALGKRLSGFDDPEAVLTAPETRSSSPVRILRGEDFQSQIRGLYPCGEGAGYAGGITSAAVDGIRCAEAFINFL